MSGTPSLHQSPEAPPPPKLPPPPPKPPPPTSAAESPAPTAAQATTQPGAQAGAARPPSRSRRGRVHRKPPDSPAVVEPQQDDEQAQHQQRASGRCRVPRARRRLGQRLGHSSPSHLQDRAGAGDDARTELPRAEGRRMIRSMISRLGGIGEHALKAVADLDPHLLFVGCDDQQHAVVLALAARFPRLGRAASRSPRSRCPAATSA